MKDNIYKIITATDHKEAIEFASSPRGQLILSQALYVSIKTIDDDSSNVSDMKYLQHYVFPMYKDIKEVEVSKVYEHFNSDTSNESEYIAEQLDKAEKILKSIEYNSNPAYLLSEVKTYFKHKRQGRK